MRDSTKKPLRVKPPKPRPDFPLFPHATRRWAKKIRGRLHYFGPWENPQEALENYLKVKDYLHDGLTPPPPAEDEEKTIGFLCNEFLTSKFRKMESGSLTRRSFLDYKRTTDMIVAEFGKHRRVDDLRQEDFARYRVKLSRKLGVTSLGNEINRIRILFRYACEERDIVDKPLVKLVGKDFVKPEKKFINLYKSNQKLKHGERMLEAHQIRQLLDAADPTMRCMILLGVNCGLGQSDIAGLRKHHLNLTSGWLDYPRPKTGVDRECSLWPETVAALRAAIATRPNPKDKEDNDRVFLTHHGNPWVRYSLEYQNEKGEAKGGAFLDSVARKFIDLLKDAGFHRRRLGFYTLRHVTETIGSEVKDQIALDRIMGHSDSSMGSNYRERIGRERIKAVADHIHSWLFDKK